MHYLLTLFSFVLLASPQAQACRGPSMENTLFFKAISNPPAGADVIAKVALLDVTVMDFYKGEATAKVLQVIGPAEARVHKGDIISLKYLVSSCGPYDQSGHVGTIVAKAVTDCSGRLVWHPYTYRVSDGTFWAPSINK